MTRDEERREVAAKLRAKHRERNRPGVFVPQDAGMQVWDYLRDLEECLPDGDSAFTVLADLIEPEPERTCRIVGAHTAHASTHLRKVGRCSDCGELIETDHRHCFNCGAKVVAE